MTAQPAQIDLGNTEDVITVDDVVKRLKLNKNDAWQVLAAMRTLELLDLGPKQREPGKTGRGKQSYRVPEDEEAVQRFRGILKKLQRASTGYVVRRRKGRKAQ
jgi:predicted ArsR family transcriptional regulator